MKDDVKDDLTHLSAAEIDALPFGYIALAPDGTIRRYNRFEADLARRDPQQVLGRNFFREVAPCTQVRDFEGRFRGLLDNPGSPATLSFDFEFAFRHGRQKVRIGLIRSPLEREVIVTVNRVRALELPTSSELAADPVRGTLTAATGLPVVMTGSDFWTCLDDGAGDRRGDDSSFLYRLGQAWARQHVLRAERLIQEQHTRTLREVEIQIAFEVLSGSIGTLGLGRFDIDLGLRDLGLIVSTHSHSPFPLLLGDRDGCRCTLLAGMYAGFLAYLAGRDDLAAREVACSRDEDHPCRFVIGLPSRLERLFGAAPGSRDAELLERLGATPAASEVPARG